MSLRSLRIALADDELVARKRLTRLLEATPGVEVAGIHASAAELLAQVAQDAIDVVVLDVQMPGMTGIEAHALLGEDGPYVIFATAHPQHAVEAFELGAVDYVLKPIEAARLSKAVDRARRHWDSRAQALPEPTPASAGRLPVVTRQGIVLLDPLAVSHAIFDGTLVTVVTVNGDRHLADVTLQDLHDRLDDSRFDRVHRRVLVNLHEVTILKPTGTGGFQAKMRSGDEVPISRQSARRLRKALGLAK